jgi:hypothetical protein
MGNTSTLYPWFTGLVKQACLFLVKRGRSLLGPVLDKGLRSMRAAN